MASSRELMTSIVLRGQTDPSLRRAFQNASKMADSNLQKLQQFGQKAKTIMKAGAVAVGSGFAASAKAAIDYESAFAGVMKTVDETSKTSYDDLSKGIIAMSRRMPAAATEIAGVAEAAGQLGIKADDVLKFTETMVNLGETTNLSSDEAATQIAKLFNITGTSMDKVGNFGATLVALGNNAATTESDILNMASRIASSGNQIGFTEQQTLALATSLSSVGMEAEAGGTAISTVMTKIDKSVATNDETLSTWAKTAGMSASDFSKAWGKDAYGTLQKVINGMSDTTKSGGNLNLVLEDLGITGIREADTMKRLSSASKMMGEMTTLANKAWDENMALGKEANTRYATLASKMGMLKNNVTAFAIAVGNKVTPYIGKMVDVLNGINFDAIAEKIGNAIKWIADHSTQLVVVIGSLAGAFAAVKILGVVKGFVELVKVVQIMVKSFGLLKIAMAFMGGPVTIIVAAIGLLIGGLVALWMKSESFRNFWKGLWQGIKDITSTVVSGIVTFFTQKIPAAFNWLVSVLAGIGGKIKIAFQSTVTFLTTTVPAAISNFIGRMKTAVVNFFTVTIPAAFTRFKTAVGSAINTAVFHIKRLPYYIGYAVGFIGGKIVGLANKFWNFATVTVPQFVNRVVAYIRTLPTKIQFWFVATQNKVINWGTRMISLARAKMTQFVTAAVNNIRTLPARIWGWLVTTAQKVTAWGARMISIGRAKATQFVTATVAAIRQIPGKVMALLNQIIAKVTSWGSQMAAKGRSAANQLKTGIVTIAQQIPAKMAEIGKNIVHGIWSGIVGAKDYLTSKVKSFCSGVVKGFKDSLKIHSPSVVMQKLVGAFIPQGIAEGINKNARYALSAVNNMGGKLTAAAARIRPTIGGVAARAAGKIRAYANGGTVTQPHMAVVGDAPETIVPHGNTARNRALLNEAARGVGGGTGGAVFNFTFAPVVNGGNAVDNRRMLQDEEAEFEKRMTAWTAKNGRFAF